MDGKSQFEALIYQGLSDDVGLNYKKAAIVTFYTRYVRY